jgi:hypothetical protein
MRWGPIARTRDSVTKVHLEGMSDAGVAALALTLAASPASPVENVVLVVKGWGDGGASLTLDGREVPRGRDFRVGHRRRLEATDLSRWSARSPGP